MTDHDLNIKEISFPLHQLIFNIAGITRVIKESVANHHFQVAFATLEISRQLDWNHERREKAVIAAMLHDLGMFSQNSKFNLLSSEFKHSRHAEIGAHLVSELPLRFSSSMTDIIRYHHHPWQSDGSQHESPGTEIPAEAHLINFCDRISLLIQEDEEILSQRERVLSELKEKTPEIFRPGLTAHLSDMPEHFWLSLQDEKILRGSIENFLSGRDIIMREDETMELAQFYSRVIDYRSEFTATHSWGVAGTAEKLADFLDWPDRAKKHMKIAGLFHDLGKLAVPPEIINKEGKLTAEEYNLMKSHVFYTYQVLSATPTLEHIARWAGLHHERVDGSGYPFARQGEDLSLPARIMAAADVFVALVENRPYRADLKKDQIKQILKEEGEQGGLDESIVNLLLDNYTALSSGIEELQMMRRDNFEEIRPLSEAVN